MDFNGSGSILVVTDSGMGPLIIMPTIAKLELRLRTSSRLRKYRPKEFGLRMIRLGQDDVCSYNKVGQVRFADV